MLGWILALTWALVIDLPAFANSHATSHLEVGLSDVAPISFIKHGELTGINYDIIKQIEKNSGLKFKYSLYPHARVQKVLDNSVPDFVVIFKSVCKKFSEDYEMSQELYPLKLQLLLKKSADPTKNGVRVARIRGTCVNVFNEHLKKESILEVENFQQAINMIKANRIDGICGTDAVIAHHLKQHQEVRAQLYVYKTQEKDDRFESVMCMKKSLSDDVKTKLHKASKNLKLPLFGNY